MVPGAIFFFPKDDFEDRLRRIAFHQGRYDFFRKKHSVHLLFLRDVIYFLIITL